MPRAGASVASGQVSKCVSAEGGCPSESRRRNRFRHRLCVLRVRCNTLAFERARASAARFAADLFRNCAHSMSEPRMQRSPSTSAAASRMLMPPGREAVGSCNVVRTPPYPSVLYKASRMEYTGVHMGMTLPRVATGEDARRHGGLLALVDCLDQAAVAVHVDLASQPHVTTSRVPKSGSQQLVNSDACPRPTTRALRSVVQCVGGGASLHG